MDRDLFVPTNGPPDLQGMYRFAVTEQAIARRQGRTGYARLCHSLIVRCLRALRFAARLEAGRAPGDPACSHYSHSFFSGAPEKIREALAPAATLDPDRRHTLREGRRRR